MTPAAYIKLAQRLNERGYNLVQSKQQFSSGEILWDKLDQEGYVKQVGDKRVVETKKSSGNLEKIISGAFIFSFLAGLFFSLGNLTGNVIENSASGNQPLGIVLILIGIGGFFAYKKPIKNI